jgi:uncharacterized membrane protein SpoIIM required for sporulation
MNVHEFIHSHQMQWKELEAFVQQASRLSLARVPLDEFRQGSLRYRQTVANLAYARMSFPRHAVVGQLERLVGLAHSVVYQARREKSTSWWQFWTRTWPALIRGAARPILAATLIFWVAAALGLLMTMMYPFLESFFITPAMRQAMSSGHLWTESLTGAAPQASSAIARNNISVSLLVWALGLTFGVGTVWMLLVNGLMLGVIAQACLRAGLFQALGEFIVAHGALELPAIWIAAGAGLVMGEAMLFPGRYRRSVELGLAARRSARIFVGTVPMLLVAALVEGFVSPSELPASIKIALAVTLALAYAAYIVAAPRPVGETTMRAGSGDPRPAH